MCAYKLVKVSFNYPRWTFPGKVERYIHQVLREIYLATHQLAFCTMDEWIDMSDQDVRNIELASLCTDKSSSSSPSSEEEEEDTNSPDDPSSPSSLALVREGSSLEGPMPDQPDKARTFSMGGPNSWFPRDEITTRTPPSVAGRRSLAKARL